MPLRRLNLGGCRNIRDLTPLAECEELRDLVLPPNATEIDPAGSGINFLRRLPNLERISYPSTSRGGIWTPSQTAEEFWAEWEAKRGARDEVQVAGGGEEEDEWEDGDQLSVTGGEEEWEMGQEDEDGGDFQRAEGTDED